MTTLPRQDNGIKLALERENEFMQNPAQRLHCVQAMTNDELNRIIEQQHIEEARAEALAEGRDEGRLDMLKNFLKLNLPIEMITQATGLTEEEIRKLQCAARHRRP